MPDNRRIAVIGHTGQGDYGHGIDTVWLDVPGCEIVAVADPSEAGLAKAVDRLKGPAGFADWRKMLDETKPDVVSICPRWVNQHRDLVVGAAERGIHIYMEKPLCRTLAEADEMVAACEKQNVKLAIGFQTRYSPRLQALRNLLDEGRLGKLIELRARGKEDQRGGAEDLWVLGTHLFNLMNYFAGAPRWCFAQVRQGGRPVVAADVREGNEGIGPLTGDDIVAIFGFDDGVVGHFASRVKSGPKGGTGGRFGLRLHGTEGAAEMTTGFFPPAFFLPDPTWCNMRSGAKWQPISSAGPDVPEPLKDTGTHGGNVAACLDLLSAIEEDRQPEASIYEARQTVEMIAAVFESHRVGAAVPLPLKTRVNPLTLFSA